jgi:hypothetical protein
MAIHSSRSRGRDGLQLLPLCHTGWIDVAGVRALSTLAVSEVLRGLDGEKAEAPSPPHTICGTVFGTVAAPVTLGHPPRRSSAFSIFLSCTSERL